MPPELAAQGGFADRREGRSHPFVHIFHDAGSTMAFAFVHPSASALAMQGEQTLWLMSSAAGWQEVSPAADVADVAVPGDGHCAGGAIYWPLANQRWHQAQKEAGE